MLDNQLRYSVWSVEKYRDWSWDPLIYTGVAGDALYTLLARDYAPLPQRLRAVTQRLEALPRLYEQTRANLVPARVPTINAETAVKQNPGVVSLIDELIVPHLATLPGDERARLERAIAGARTAVDAQQKWLETQLVPNAKGEFRIGAELREGSVLLAAWENDGIVQLSPSHVRLLDLGRLEALAAAASVPQQESGRR